MEPGCAIDRTGAAASGGRSPGRFPGAADIPRVIRNALGPMIANGYPSRPMEDAASLWLWRIARQRSVLTAVWISLWLLSPRRIVAAEPPTAPAPPATLALRFSETGHDFGRVRGGELVRHSFAFTNAGSGVIEITQVHPSCSCVVLGSWPSRIGPGETGEIPFEFHTVNYSGPVVETITVTGSGPTQPSVTLRVAADIWRPIDVRPAAAVFEYFPDDPAASVFTVRIVSRSDEPLHLSVPRSSRPTLTAVLSPVIPGREYDLTVRVEPPAKPANVVGTITLDTSVASMPVLEIPVHALVPSPVSVVPRTLRLPAAPGSTAVSCSVQIRNHSPNPLTLGSPAVNVTGATVMLNETVPGRRFTLVLSLAAGADIPASGTAEVTLTSNHPQFPMLRIPIVLPKPPDTRSPSAPNP